LVFERVFVILILLLADVELFFADDEGAETEFVEPVGDSNIDILSDMGFLLTLFILAMVSAYLFLLDNIILIYLYFRVRYFNHAKYKF
jgi:hypothetical protein